MAPSAMLHSKHEYAPKNMDVGVIMEPYYETTNLILTQVGVAIETGMQILSEFQDMMSHQSRLAADGADQDDQYWELVFANLGCGLTMISGFCTAINPIDFTLWTIVVFVLGALVGLSMAFLGRHMVEVVAFSLKGIEKIKNVVRLGRKRAKVISLEFNDHLD